MLKTLLSTLLFLFSFFTIAEIPAPEKRAITFEAGSSLFVFNNMHPAQRIGFLSYRTEWTYVFTNVFAGGFGPARDTYFAGADIGLSFWHFGLSTGAGWLTHTSASLSTHWQLSQTLRFSIPSTPVYISFKHFSNGHKVFKHHHTPNHGENFLTLGIQYDF